MEDLIFNQWGCNAFHGDFVTMPKFIEKIKNGFCDLIVKRIRDEFKLNGKSDLYKQNKSKLPGITISGRFSTARRKLENLEEYYGWKVLDIDNIDSEEKYQFIFNKVKEIPYTKVAFRSPTGNGLKIFVETNNRNSAKHSEYYKEVINYYESILNVEFDSSTCDVSRLCYYSYDPDIYYNEDSEIFEFGTLGENLSNEESHENIFETQFVKEIQFAIDFTNKVTKFRDNNRNNYIYLLSKNCCGYGLQKQTVIDYCIINFSDEDFDENEIILAIENGYQEKKSDFGKWKSKLERDIRTPKIEKNEIRDSSSIYEFEKLFSNVNSTFLKNYNAILNQLKTENDKEMYNLGVKTTLKSIFNLE